MARFLSRLLNRKPEQESPPRPPIPVIEQQIGEPLPCGNGMHVIVKGSDVALDAGVYDVFARTYKICLQVKDTDEFIRHAGVHPEGRQPDGTMLLAVITGFLDVAGDKVDGLIHSVNEHQKQFTESQQPYKISIPKERILEAIYNDAQKYKNYLQPIAEPPVPYKKSGQRWRSR